MSHHVAVRPQEEVVFAQLHSDYVILVVDFFRHRRIDNQNENHKQYDERIQYAYD